MVQFQDTAYDQSWTGKQSGIESSSAQLEKFEHGPNIKK